MTRRPAVRPWMAAAACAIGIIAGVTAPAWAAPYTVQQGDTYWSLAKQAGVGVRQLEAANPGHPAWDLYPGLVLNIPGGAPVKTAVAVSAGNTAAVGNADVRLLAQLAVAEEGNRSYTDMLGVAAVVMNRLHHGGFGSTVRGIVFSGTQFTSVANGYFWNVAPTATSLRAAAAAVAGADPTGGALYFYDPGPGVSSAWIYTRPVTTVINGTVYAR